MIIEKSSFCPYCKKEIVDSQHRLVDIVLYHTDDNKLAFWEKWKCSVRDQDFRGEISSNANPEAREDYSLQLKLFIKNLEIQMESENPMHYKERGKIYFDKEIFKQAMSDYNYALDLNPNDGETYYLRSLVYKRLGKLDLAEIDRQKAKLKGFAMDENFVNNV